MKNNGDIKQQMHEESARRAGLHYVTDGIRGITRKRAGKGWSFYGPNGHRISNKARRKRILALVIPPAWSDVWICPDTKGHIQVTARDARGRKQYRYHPLYREERDKHKFQRLFSLGEVIPRIRAQVKRDLGSRRMKRQVLATVVTLLEKTLIRVGNDEYAKSNSSYGLTTLKKKHVKIEGTKMLFSFKGKSGISHTISFTHRRIANIIQTCKGLRGQDLFQYIDTFNNRLSITSDDVNQYLKEISGEDISAKDFRTWGGTMLAGKTLRSIGVAATQYEAKRNINKALDVVAEKLGNTRLVCKKYYIHPLLLEAYLESKVAPEPAKTKAKRDKRSPEPLSNEEIVILRFLKHLT